MNSVIISDWLSFNLSRRDICEKYNLHSEELSRLLKGAGLRSSRPSAKEQALAEEMCTLYLRDERWKVGGHFWKTITINDCLLTVCSSGEIWEASKSRLKRPAKTKAGYFTVNVKGKTFYQHRLVAEAFLPNTYKLPEVNHKNRNKLDNSVGNLEWISKEDNVAHALEKSWSFKNPKGEIITVQNLSRFCKEEGLTLSILYKVIKKVKHYKSHKGYTSL